MGLLSLRNPLPNPRSPLPNLRSLSTGSRNPPLSLKNPLPRPDPALLPPRKLSLSLSACPIWDAIATEATRSQRRARILQAQREAMWSDEESEEEPEPAEEASNDAESKEPIFSENPDVAERVGAITKRVDQLKALLSSCPEANRDFVNGHIVSLQAEIAVLTAASRAVQNLSRKTTPRSTA